MDGWQEWWPTASRKFSRGLRDTLGRELLRQLIEYAPAAICVVREAELSVELVNTTCRRRMAEIRPLRRTLGELLPSCHRAIESDEAQRALRRGQVWIFAERAARVATEGVQADVAWTWLIWRIVIRSQAPRLVLLGIEGALEHVELSAAERARAHEEDAVRTKNEVIARLLHELRGPLAPIQAALEILRGPEPIPRERVLTILNRQFHYLVRLIDDVSELSRDGRGGLTMNREWIELGSVVEQAVELVAPMLAARRHALTLDMAQPVFIEGDAGRLVQVVANLLTNAAKYTHDGGSIRISARQDGSDVALCVRDNGIGMSADVLPHVFDMFVRSPRARHTRDGLGIGLYVVRQLVNQHGGTVEARSAGPGHGSEFVVRLPSSSAEHSSPL